MSDTGLYGSLYEQLRSYADKLDCGLIALRSHSNEVAQNARYELAALLREIASKESTKPAAHFIAIILNQELATVSGQGLALCATLARALEARSPSPAELSELEQIATLLDQECSSTLARMRGQG